MNETVFLGACPVIRPEGIYYEGRRVIALTPGLGAVERQNPLPAGRYWVDVFAPDADTFGAWLSSNKATVNVVATEHYATNPPGDWYLFVVTAPTPWSGPGFPTIATSDVTSASDTAQRPDLPPSTTTQIEQMLESAKKTSEKTMWVAIAALTLAGGVLLVRYLPRPAPALRG